MHIYIDESGNFTFADESKRPWSVIGAYAVDESMLNDIDVAYEKLKRYSGQSDNEELKSSDIDGGDPAGYIQFIFDLADIGGVFVPSVVYTPNSAKPSYLRVMSLDRDLSDGRADIVQERRLQLYLQANALCETTNSILWAAIGYFSKFTPTSLREFHWFADEKSLVDEFVKKRLVRFISGEGVNFNYKLRQTDGLSFEKFFEFHGNSSDQGFIVNKILGKYQFVDSKSMLGIRVADQLTGGLRRCLKGHWEDNELVIDALASLMVQQEPWLTIMGREKQVEGKSKKILPFTRKFHGLIDTESPILDRIIRRAKKLS